MRKQSIADRKYLERLEKDDPAHAAEIRRRRRYGSAKSFIKLHTTSSELDELDGVIRTRRKVLEKDETNSKNS